MGRRRKRKKEQKNEKKNEKEEKLRVKEEARGRRDAESTASSRQPPGLGTSRSKQHVTVFHPMLFAHSTTESGDDHADALFYSLTLLP